jgi:hypothetical protein
VTAEIAAVVIVSGVALLWVRPAWRTHRGMFEREGLALLAYWLCFLMLGFAALGLVMAMRGLGQ